MGKTKKQVTRALVLKWKREIVGEHEICHSRALMFASHVNQIGTYIATNKVNVLLDGRVLAIATA